MSNSQFSCGDLVVIKQSAKTVENTIRVKENTYGTINSTFEVISFCPEFEIKGDISPAACWITPVGKPHSSVGMYVSELQHARTSKQKAEKPIEVDDLVAEPPDLSDFEV